MSDDVNIKINEIIINKLGVEESAITVRLFDAMTLSPNKLLL